MHRSVIAATAAMLISAWTAAAQQVTTVVGTGDPNVDVPAIQAAVDQGGHVVLRGHFSFDRPPTKWIEHLNGRTILVSKQVVISGALGEQGEMTTIDGGDNPFAVDAAGSHVTIQGLHFIRPKEQAIIVLAVSGLVIANCRVEGVEPLPDPTAPTQGQFAAGILITTNPTLFPPSATQPGQPENVSGTLSISNNDIDVGGTAGDNTGGITVFAVGKSPDNEVDLYILGNNIRNTTERFINIYSVGGRAHIERNAITTGAVRGPDVAPSPDVIHIVGPGTYLIAHNSIECSRGWGAGIRLQTRPEQPVLRAVVVDNDVNMSAPEGTTFDITSAAIEVRGAGEGNMVLNNRIRGRANFALSVAAQNGTPQGTAFIMNDLQNFTSAQADLFIDAGGTGTIAVGGQGTVEDHGVGTVVVPMPEAARSDAIAPAWSSRR